MTHLEKQEQVSRRVGRNRATVSIVPHGSGKRIKVLFTRGELYKKEFKMGFKAALKLFPTLNPKRIVRHAITQLS